MVTLKLTARQIQDRYQALARLSEPHPHTTTDGKTVVRDFDIPPKAKMLLLITQRNLKTLIEDNNLRQIDVRKAFIPRGEKEHTPEEVANFLHEIELLLREVRDVEIHQVYITHDKCDKPDAITLTKAEIPAGMLVDLYGTVLIDLPESAPK